MGRLVLLLLVFLIVPVLWVTECSGPMPEVRGVTVREPAQPGLPYAVDVELHNRWRGHGTVQVRAELHDPAGDRRYQGQETADLDPGESTRVVVPVNAEPGNYEPSVEVKYPPG